jgi:glucosamine kinase
VTKSFFIGVDGGATKCTVRVEDETGNLLAEAMSGPANIRISVPMAWQAIHTALENALKPLGISVNDPNSRFHAGIGIAGCEIGHAYKTFIHFPHKFHSLEVTHDSHTACLGAHGGKDGALIIAGTGVAGYQIESGQTVKVSGWGFPHDDIGSGAWLGLEAARVALQWQDGRTPSSGLAKAVMAHFDNQLNRFVSWANQANSTAFAELAPLVIQVSKAGDAAALNLLRGAGRALDAVGSALHARQDDKTISLPCALTGGIAPFIEPYLGNAVRARLVPCQLPPEAGAILYLRKMLAQAKE